MIRFRVGGNPLEFIPDLSGFGRMVIIGCIIVALLAGGIGWTVGHFLL